MAKIIGDTPEMVMKAYAHSLDDEELRATKILSSLIKLKWISFLSKFGVQSGVQVILVPIKP
ncbi:hypothetical protein [Lysinibacillus xylanilyticus]|uniref:Uncharacterized protein n=1 Tax=Lysinibacillus xylanilyticus TaxID=582475 RepID=A0ABT4EU08_9BACI|nr:hypothetical protein [Lysinibacillus xylanilyticus]MCY9549110.1 hypothetical protein [Lysinibacillus xylanilyticus]